jgi:hypothetical protein
VRWTAAELAGLTTTQQATFAEMAARLGRSEAAVRRQRSRVQRRQRPDELSLAEVARRAGYDRSVVERVSRGLGHRWSSNGLSGVRTRYWLAREEAEEVLRYIAAPLWSSEAADCRSCKTRRIPHKARGLCRRCYKRAWKERRCSMK